ncbi:peptide-methionine (R)-S-oxide reductase MsrB [Vitreimonas sp.]|jgi:peptide-methionine (R)-S-oxide reductase|uniref:peptide-methionine (R)-S-oxide reductase MsrB n=1 Tax=Vitreimonas sp. TaxID=3069702 RepID=UPI002EDAFC59
MKLITAFAAAALVLSGAGVYAYAQTRANEAAEQQVRRDPNAFERLRAWVMERGGTERAFANEYWDHHETGLYVEARTGEALFASTSKFDSGSGWPSFTRPINPDAITLHEDNAFGMRRIEVRSREGNHHLGHVFDDGPRDSGGQRFCINSCAIRFIPRDRMEAEGYGRYLPIVDGETPSLASR